MRKNASTHPIRKPFHSSGSPSSAHPLEWPEIDTTGGWGRGIGGAEVGGRRTEDQSVPAPPFCIDSHGEKYSLVRWGLSFLN